MGKLGTLNIAIKFHQNPFRGLAAAGETKLKYSWEDNYQQKKLARTSLKFLSVDKVNILHIAVKFHRNPFSRLAAVSVEHFWGDNSVAAAATKTPWQR